ncbi:MAG: L-alanine-DL-glutamate epimerase [Acidobacteria bacterium]|nr:L-alanine-DL-glutamate epimerase [Acidobacteriota bacterium]
MRRRDLLRTAAHAGVLSTLGPLATPPGVPSAPAPERRHGLRIADTDSNFEREPLRRPFGFKGGYMSEIWQTAALAVSADGTRRIGLGTQSVLWSDARVFATHSESGGNALMYAITERALALARDRDFTTPVALLEGLLPEVHDYARAVTAQPDLRMTFTLNALVPVDNAAWLVYATETGPEDFDAMVPADYRPALAHRHHEVAAVPLMAYTIPISEIREAAEDGFFVMKIKIGQPGTQEEMLEKDKARLSEIHAAIGHLETPHTTNGRLPYYFDANGRYESKESLERLLDHARAIGAFDQIVVLEEPFPEALEVRVDDLGVRVAADESAHTDADATRRIELGYRAIALKAIAKTLSMTLKIARVAHEAGVPCFCADLTVNPILVEWNKSVAARLAPFPGLGLGLLETNGHQNYRDWERMRGYRPCPDAPWATPENGVFRLGEDFYRRSACLFEPSAHYEAMFAPRE